MYLSTFLSIYRAQLVTSAYLILHFCLGILASLIIFLHGEERNETETELNFNQLILIMGTVLINEDKWRNNHKPIPNLSSTR